MKVLGISVRRFTQGALSYFLGRNKLTAVMRLGAILDGGGDGWTWTYALVYHALSYDGLEDR